VYSQLGNGDSLGKSAVPVVFITRGEVVYENMKMCENHLGLLTTREPRLPGVHVCIHHHGVVWPLRSELFTLWANLNS
jgi:hypothetical protein